MTGEDFEREYAKRSDITLERLRKIRTVRPCDCGDKICPGWQSVSHEIAALMDAGEWYPHEIDEEGGIGLRDE